MVLKEFWKRFGSLILQIVAAIGVVLIIVKHFLSAFGPPTTKERDKKVKEKIDDHLGSTKSKSDKLREEADEIKKEHRTRKQRHKDRDKRDDKFFSN